MSVLVMGLSHRSAGIEVLERAALTVERADELTRRLRSGDNVHEAVAVSTCNRLEVYAAVGTFHGAVSEISLALSAATGLPREILHPHLYVHYEDRAIAHAFSVACGLDSMALGETQILGQLRDALRRGQSTGLAGPQLNSLLQQALRVGKRAHAETEVDRVSRSLVEVGLSRAEQELGATSSLSVLIVGAGSMSGLTAAAVARREPAALTVISRTAARAHALASAHGGTARPSRDLPSALAEADLVVCCAGAGAHVVGWDAAAAAGAARGGRAQMYLDLAMPRDVDPRVARLPAVSLVSLAALGELAAGDGGPPGEITAVEHLVTAEVAAYLTRRRRDEVAPTVAALRARAADVVSAELSRLAARVPELSPAARGEVALAVHRVVEKLLHTPTVRVKELAGIDHHSDYAHALRELFDLDPYDVAAVSSPPEGRLP